MSNNKKHSKSILNSNNKFPTNQTTRAMQINMSTLSSAQKQICIKLLAQSNINFQQAIDGFQAELKIDPMKLTTEFKLNQIQQNQRQLNKVSPIKKRPFKQNKYSKQPQRQKQSQRKRIQYKKYHNRTLNIKIQQNKQNNKKHNLIIQTHSNNNITSQIKRSIKNIYTSSKKSLQKTVKVHELKRLQQLHPEVQLYIYPKKMSLNTLIEFIELVYDRYWKGNVNNLNVNQKRSVKKQQKKQQLNQYNKESSFCDWVYYNFIVNEREKIKLEQNLVNLIESLNHFSYKNLGVQLFYNFMSGIYQEDCLRYFLVIRALLEQIYAEKIIDKVSNFASKTGIIYKMKMNPYEKLIEQQKVHQFLDVCCCNLDRSRKDQSQIVQKLFNQMTESMFYDEKKKKNFIQFHQMCEVLLKQFVRIDSGHVSKLELSYTQNQSDQINQNFYQIQQNTINFEEDQLQLTFSVHEQEQDQQNYNDEINQSISSTNNLNEYLPAHVFEQLSLKPQQQEKFQDRFKTQVYKRFEQICMTFSQNQIFNSNTQNKAIEILQILLETITKCNKNKWIQFIKNKKISLSRQNQELYFIEKLQIEYNEYKKANFISKQLINKLFTAPYLRQTIIEVYSPILHHMHLSQQQY